MSQGNRGLSFFILIRKKKIGVLRSIITYFPFSFKSSPQNPTLNMVKNAFVFMKFHEDEIDLTRYRTGWRCVLVRVNYREIFN